MESERDSSLVNTSFLIVPWAKKISKRDRLTAERDEGGAANSFKKGEK